MAIVTVTGHLGSIGDVPSLVADELGYRLAGPELRLQVAAALNCDEADVCAFDERIGGIGARIMRSFERWALQGSKCADLMSGITPPAQENEASLCTADEQYVRTLIAVMQRLGSEGDIVLVGHGGQALFAHDRDAVHVRLTCAISERAQRVAHQDTVSLEVARSRVLHEDQQREAWHHLYFGIDYRVPYQYDLVLNTGRLPDVFTAHLIAQVVRVRSLISAGGRSPF